jgi:hypothetical protein
VIRVLEHKVDQADGWLKQLLDRRNKHILHRVITSMWK